MEARLQEVSPAARAAPPAQHGVWRRGLLGSLPARPRPIDPDRTEAAWEGGLSGSSRAQPGVWLALPAASQQLSAVPFPFFLSGVELLSGLREASLRSIQGRGLHRGLSTAGFFFTSRGFPKLSEPPPNSIVPHTATAPAPTHMSMIFICMSPTQSFLSLSFFF